VDTGPRFREGDRKRDVRVIRKEGAGATKGKSARATEEQGPLPRGGREISEGNGKRKVGVTKREEKYILDSIP